MAKHLNLRIHSNNKVNTANHQIPMDSNLSNISNLTASNLHIRLMFVPLVVILIFTGVSISAEQAKR
jgi:hypothetical protein